MWRRKKTRSSFLSFGWILSFWTVTVHFSHFYMRNIIPGQPEMETSGHVPPNWTRTDVLSMAATQRQTHRRSQNIASSPPTNGISFSAAEGTKVRKTLAAFQQAPPSTPHHHLQPPPSYVPQQAVRLLSTGNIFHGKGSVTL